MAEDSELSRRGFIKGTTLASLGVAAGMALTGYATQAEAEEAAATTSDLQTQYTADILIIGGGQAGFCAGIHALELGVKNVLIIDKDSGEDKVWGGSSMVCGGSLLIPVSESQDDADAYSQAIFEHGLEHADMDLIKTLGDNAWNAYQWMIGQGVQYADPISVFPAHPEVLTAVSDMTVTMPLLRDNFTKAGGQLVYGAKAKKLNVDAGGVCGALVKSADGWYNVSAKKTILCTGGYAANKQFLEDHIGEKGDTVMCRARENATGDGIYMAQAIGGCTIGSAGIKSIHMSAVDPIAVQKGQPGNDIPHFIAVNTEGKRFVDEALGSVPHGQAVFNLDVPKDGLICDSKVYDTVSATFDKLHKNNVETWQTDTLADMAAIFGCPADVLQSTVDEFNAAIVDDHTEGLSPDKTLDAVSVDTPPYYGIFPLVPGCSLTFGGLSTSTAAEVLECDGEPIPNLYAAGEGTGNFFYDDYFGGSCLMRDVVFGHIAVESAIASM